MTKWVKIIDGVVDTVAVDQPGHFETVIDIIEGEGDQPDTQSERKVFVPDKHYVEASDDVYAGFACVGEKYIAPPKPAPTINDVNAERDRRTSAGFMFGAKRYDFDMRAKTNIMGAAQMASNSILLLAKLPTDIFWHGGAQPFAWIAADNTLTVMDAQTAIAFGNAAAAHESSQTFAARKIKNMPTVPTDYANDTYWS